MTGEPNITPYALPGILAEIAEATCVEIAVALARKHGGQRLYLPREPKRDHHLCRLLGVQAARIICARWGSERHEIPSAKPYLHWYDARRLRGSGLSHGQIARAIGIGHQRVRELLAGFEETPADAEELMVETASECPVCGHRHRARGPHRPDPRQMSLF